MRHSIRFKLSLIIMSMVAGLIAFICVFNIVFLEKYYMRIKENALVDAFLSVSTVIEDDTATKDDLLNTLYQVNSEHNVSVLIVDSSFNLVYALQSDVENTISWLKENIFNPNIQREIITSGNNYVLQKGFNQDERRNYLEIIGNNTDSMYNIIMQVPLESISENVQISNQFFIIGGIIAVILGGIIAYFTARQFTNPIKKLSSAAESMAEMNFDVKYETKDKGEIGLLGNSINKMSDNLKMYISDLKTANLELQKDIEKKTEIDNMRKDFISNVSHELKTPISLIQGYAEGLKDGISDDPESMAFYCDVIMDEANKMNKMVKQLLNLNQLESGKDPLSIERFDIVKHIVEIVKTNTIRAEQKKAVFIYEETEPEYVWADQFKIEEVVTNYISNAINHVEEVEGENHIRIWLEKEDKKVRVLVYNTGKSIPEADIPHIWDKFYKVDKARTREYGGSGVGLSIVKAILDAHKQNYGVENYKNGVVFWFELDCENA